MHTLVLTILTLSPSIDSLETDTTVEVRRSILFLDRTVTAPGEPLRYDHRQGVFCDFEDRLSRGRRFRIDLGVGGER